MSGRINENKSGRNVEQQTGVVRQQQQIYRLRFNSSRALFFLFLPLGLSSPPHPACWLYPSRMHFSLIDFHCCARAFLADAAAAGRAVLVYYRIGLLLILRRIMRLMRRPPRKAPPPCRVLWSSSSPSLFEQGSLKALRTRVTSFE